jgi:phenylalanyl-tRNA synthetase beta subunit
MRPSRASALLGYQVPSAAAVRVFDDLGLATRVDDERIEVEVPGTARISSGRST